MLRIYGAGGWFGKEMEEEHTRILSLMEEHFDVFNPRKKGEIDASTTHDHMAAILIGNIEGIQQADVVVAIYDYKDTGTIWETGFAYGNQKPIIYYAEKLNGKKFNLMLAKTGFFASNEQELLELLQFLSRVKDTFGFIPFKDVYNDYKGEIE